MTIIQRDGVDEEGQPAASDRADIPYEQLVENAHEGIAIIQDEQFVYCNERFEELVGAEPTSLEGSDFLQYVAEDERATVAERYEDRLDGGDPPKQYRITTDDDTIVEATGTRIEYDGRPAVKAVLRDVTEQQRYEEALAGLNDVSRGFPRAETKADIGTLVVEKGTTVRGIDTLQL